MKTIKQYGYRDLADKLWDYLENVKFTECAMITSVGKLDRLLMKVMVWASKDGLKPEVGVNIERYLARAREAILEYNFSYDEALGIVNMEFGYNWNGDTGEWANPEMWLAIIDWIPEEWKSDEHGWEWTEVIDSVYMSIISKSTHTNMGSEIAQAFSELGHTVGDTGYAEVE